MGQTEPPTRDDIETLAGFYRAIDSLYELQALDVRAGLLCRRAKAAGVAPAWVRVVALTDADHEAAWSPLDRADFYRWLDMTEHDIDEEESIEPAATNPQVGGRLHAMTWRLSLAKFAQQDQAELHDDALLSPHPPHGCDDALVAVRQRAASAARALQAWADALEDDGLPKYGALLLQLLDGELSPMGWEDIRAKASANNQASDPKTLRPSMKMLIEAGHVRQHGQRKGYTITAGGRRAMGKIPD